MTIFNGRVRTASESVDRISRLGAALRELGITPGDRVGILANNSDRYHEFVYGSWWIGAAINPVNTRWSTAEIALSLKESGTEVLVVGDEYCSAIPALQEKGVSFRHVIRCGEGPPSEKLLDFDTLIDANDPIEDLRPRGDHMAGIFYTGGTTGRPKGVMLSHAGIMTSALGCLSFLDSASGVGLLVSPMFHLAALNGLNFNTLTGSTSVILPRFEADAVMRTISDYKVTSVRLVPSMIRMLLEHPRFDSFDLSSVTSLIYGASPMTTTTLERAMRAFPNVSFTQSYGMTELSPVATHLDPVDHLRGGPLLQSAGRAAAHCEIRIVDAGGVEVRRGVVGEIVVRGGNLMLGYWNQPEATEEVLRDGWLHTGDLAYMDEDGYIFIVDRQKDMIVSGGENVYSAEVENILAKHPAIQSCAVIGVPDERWGERVHAVVVCVPGRAVTLEEIRTYCRKYIAGYKCPATLSIVDAMPSSPTGKVLKKELRDLFWTAAERGVN